MHRAPTFLAVAALVAGCLTPTEVKVQVTSRDLSCGSGLLVYGGLELLARAKPSELASGTSDGTSSACKAIEDGIDLGSVVLTPRDGSSRAELLVAAAVHGPGDTSSLQASDCLEQYRDYLRSGATDDYCKSHNCGACIIARRGIGFVSHTKLSLEVELRADCQGVFCNEGQTCGRDGKCVSAEATCEGPRCDLGAGGAGGASGSGVSTSVSSASVASSSAAASGTGGAGGGPCLDPGGGNTLGLTHLTGSVGDGTEIASAHDGSAWVVASTSLYRCSALQCGIANGPTGHGANVAIAASPTVVAVSQPAGVSLGPSGWPYTAACGATAPVDVQVLGNGSVMVAGPNGNASTITKIGDPACMALVSGPASTTTREWVFTGGKAWLASGGEIHLQGSSIPSPLVGQIWQLWGYVGPNNEEVVYACGANGLMRFKGSQAPPVPLSLSGHPCNSVSGFARCDGTADVWVVEQSGALVGYHDDPALPTAAAAKAVVTAAGGKSVAVDDASIWVLTTTDVEHSPRPNL